MCSPSVIGHVIANLSPSDRASGSTGRPPGAIHTHAVSFSEACDLTHPLTEDFPSVFGEQWMKLEDFMVFEDGGVNFKRWSLHEHIGTHIDAPIHFSKDGLSVDQIPLDSLIAPLAVIDIRARAAESADAELTPDDIAEWEACNGRLPKNCCVAMNSGWDRFATGAGYRNADPEGTMHFPGFHAEAADMLLRERDVVGIGVDTLSVDHGKSSDVPVHRLWLPAGRWAVEGLANLSRLPEAGATIIVGAPKVVGGTGGPSRIIALN